MPMLLFHCTNSSSSEEAGSLDYGAKIYAEPRVCFRLTTSKELSVVALPLFAAEIDLENSIQLKQAYFHRSPRNGKEHTRCLAPVSICRHRSLFMLHYRDACSFKVFQVCINEFIDAHAPVAVKLRPDELQPAVHCMADEVRFFEIGHGANVGTGRNFKQYICY
jgi:hypothetical protein